MSDMMFYLQCINNKNKHLINVYEFRIKYPALTLKIHCDLMPNTQEYREYFKVVGEEEMNQRIEQMLIDYTPSQLEVQETLAILGGFNPIPPWE